jgi:hypothetical protein
VRTILAALAVTLIAADARSQENQIQLKDGPGREVVVKHCLACHSLDYTLMNSPFLNPLGWETEVNKMIEAFGARIEPAEAKIIIDYLAKNYGDGS